MKTAKPVEVPDRIRQIFAALSVVGLTLLTACNGLPSGSGNGDNRAAAVGAVQMVTPTPAASEPSATAAVTALQTPQTASKIAASAAQGQTLSAFSFTADQHAQASQSVNFPAFNQPGAYILTNRGNGLPLTLGGTQFQALPTPSGTYRLENVVTGTCVTAQVSALYLANCSQPDQEFQVLLHGMIRHLASGLILTGGVTTTLATPTKPASALQSWVGDAAPQARISIAARGLASNGPALNAGTTLRMVQPVSGSGTGLRLSLSNRYGKTPLTLGPVTLAKQANAAIPASKPLPVRFGGHVTVTIPAGQDLYSDPVNLPVNAGEKLLISAYVPNHVASTTWHRYAFDSTYFGNNGDHTSAMSGTSFGEVSTESFFVNGVDALSRATPRSLVALGDSLTDGYGTATDEMQRWPDYLNLRLRAAGEPKVSVVNAGIGSNFVTLDLTNEGGVSAQTRFDTDVLGRSGTTGVMIFAGINDVAGDASAATIIKGLQGLINRARAAHLKVNLFTVTPYRGWSSWTAARDTKRETVNAWIRKNSAGVDYVVDADELVRDPAARDRIAKQYDSGDHLHLSATGYQALAGNIDLNKLAY